MSNEKNLVPNENEKKINPSQNEATSHLCLKHNFDTLVTAIISTASVLISTSATATTGTVAISYRTVSLLY